MVISGTSINLSSWNFDPIDDEDEVTLNASLGEDPENESELGSSSVKGDSFSQIDSGKKVHELRPSSRDETATSSLEIGGLGESEENTKLDMSNEEDKEKYLQGLFDQYENDIKEALETGDHKNLEKVFDEINKKIEDDFKNGVIEDSSSPNGGEESFSKADLERAVAEAEKAQRDVLNDLRNKASGAGGRGAGGNNAGGFDGSDLERQARIDKWEALKDQQMVYYLKATLAGIKASQSLAKSVQ
jgi:hypothetical protein